MISSRKLACLILVFCACQSAFAGAAPSAVEALLAHGVREIVFAERSFAPDGHWYANFGYRFNGPRNAVYGRNGRLAKLDVKTGQVTALLEDREGAVRDPQVHYDARKILFSYRRGGTEQFHLYEINVDPSTSLRAGGTGLRQLTDGIYDDMEPCYLPDGGIVFVSSRSKRWVQCWQVQVATLYRCDADGGNIRPLSANVEMDNTPWVLPDGRLIYMRWEYVDRSQVKFHHLWTCNPDKPEGRVLLNGDYASVYSVSYFTLTSLGLVSDGRNRHGNTARRSVGDSASRLMTLLDGTHHDAKPSRAEIEMVRNWIHVGAPYPGTYAALGTGMVRPNTLPRGYGAAWQQAQTAHKRRCEKCHRGLPALERYTIAGGNRDGLRNTHLAYNLTRPAKSPMLLAPLARKAGGWGMQKRGKDGKPAGEMVVVFQDTSDPDYQAILKFIDMGRLCLQQNKRWDMPGFKPHPFYVREMKRYGILPEALDPAQDDVDVFEIDRRYWASSWHYPDGGGPRLYANERARQTLLSPRAAARIAPPGAIEGESLKVVRCDGGRHWTQELRQPSHQWSGNKHLIWAHGKRGQSIAIEFGVAESATYAITIRMTKARDYGVFQLSLDGKRLGKPVDLFSRNVEPAAPMGFGVHSLAKGVHILRVEAVGSSSDVKLPHSVGIHLFGLDYLVLTKK